MFVAKFSHSVKTYMSSANTLRDLSELKKGEKHEKIKFSNHYIVASVPNGTVTDFRICRRYRFFCTSSS
ncbi:hypothetical protein LSP03_20540 [Lysinibacillus sphaericus]|nr:hypothetical protein LSP03_20540 [Lysinibacillus sphaericus]